MTTARSSLIQRAFLPMMTWNAHTLALYIIKVIIDTHINKHTYSPLLYFISQDGKMPPREWDDTRQKRMQWISWHQSLEKKAWISWKSRTLFHCARLVLSKNLSEHTLNLRKGGEATCNMFAGRSYNRSAIDKRKGELFPLTLNSLLDGIKRYANATPGDNKWFTTSNS